MSWDLGCYLCPILIKKKWNVSTDGSKSLQYKISVKFAHWAPNISVAESMVVFAVPL